MRLIATSGLSHRRGFGGARGRTSPAGSRAGHRLTGILAALLWSSGSLADRTRISGRVPGRRRPPRGSQAVGRAPLRRAPRQLRARWAVARATRPLVVAEVVVASRGAVEPSSRTRVLERAREEVGEEYVRAPRRAPRGPRRARTVVACAHQPSTPHRKDGIECTRCRVGVRDGDTVMRAARLDEGGLDVIRDQLRTVVEQGGKRVNVHVPPAALGYPPDIERQGAACEDRGSHPGNASWSMNASLKSLRPDSST